MSFRFHFVAPPSEAGLETHSVPEETSLIRGSVLSSVELLRQEKASCKPQQVVDREEGGVLLHRLVLPDAVPGLPYTQDLERSDLLAGVYEGLSSPIA